MSITNSPINFLHFKSFDDSLASIDSIRSLYAQIRHKSRDEVALFLADKNFFVFLKEAFFVLKDDASFFEFVCDLEMDDDVLARYDMLDFVFRCMMRKKELELGRETGSSGDLSNSGNSGNSNRDSELDSSNLSIESSRDSGIESDKSGKSGKSSMSSNSSMSSISVKSGKSVKAGRRVSFSLDKNKVKTFLVEKSELKHGNYRDKDREEAVVLRNVPWIVPLRLTSAVAFKCRSAETVAQKCREKSTVKIANLESENFVPSESGAKAEVCGSMPAEISLFDVSLVNKLPVLSYTRIVGGGDEAAFGAQDLLGDDGALDRFLEMTSRNN